MPLWNPWHGCEKLSTGCKNCYVYRSDYKYDRDSKEIKKNACFNMPIQKKRDGTYKIAAGERLDTCFTSDFFLDQADEWRRQAWKMIGERRDVEFFLLTKRVDRFYVGLPDDWGDGYENVTIGCTCETQQTADQRLPIYLGLPIRHKLIVCSPLLERIDLTSYLTDEIEMVTAAGESGTYARVCDYEWILDLREQCERAGKGFYFQQTGAKLKKDNKVYVIPRRLQHMQAKKAGINLPCAMKPYPLPQKKKQKRE